MSSGFRILAFAAVAALAASGCKPPEAETPVPTAPPEQIVQPMSFRLVASGGNCIDCVWIAAEGEITADTLAQFQAFLAAEGGASLVALHSPGGDLGVGVALGRVIRGRGMRAVVASTASGADGDQRQSGDCASACVMAFLGGVERTVPPGSRLGVHQFRGAEASIGEAEVQSVVAGLGDYLIEMGVSRDLLIDASRTPPDQIDWVTADRLEDFNLVTSRKQPVEATWRIGTMEDTALVLIADQPQPNGEATRFYVACSAGYPDEYLFAWARPLGNMGQEAGLALAQQVTSLTFFTASEQLSPPYATSGSAGNGEFIVVAGVPRPDIRQLALWHEPLILQLSGYARVSGAAFGATGHLIPRAGLSGLLQHLDRNCVS